MTPQPENQLMSCGHPESSVVQADEGTAYCGDCASGISGEAIVQAANPAQDGAFAARERALDYLRTEDYPDGWIEPAEITDVAAPDLLLVRDVVRLSERIAQLEQRDALQPENPRWREALDAYNEARHIYAPDPSEPILVWRYADAPEPLRALSRHGGDEDWLAVVPPASWGTPLWMETGTAFGCCDVQYVELPGGYIVAIGAHA